MYSDREVQRTRETREQLLKPLIYRHVKLKAVLDNEASRHNAANVGRRVNEHLEAVPVAISRTGRTPSLTSACGTLTLTTRLPRPSINFTCERIIGGILRRWRLR